jgi:hypothetical protein
MRSSSIDIGFQCFHCGDKRLIVIEDHINRGGAW